MAVIGVAVIDNGRETVRWSVPSDNSLNLSPIPRGVREYGSFQAIAALGAGDETNFTVRFNFPGAFNYLLKSFSLQFLSDDITSEFGNLGTMAYLPAGVAAGGGEFTYALEAPGQSFQGAVRSEQVYRPLGTYRRWIMGSRGDTMISGIQDMSGDASTAGDIFWQAEFWEYDIEQCLKWPVNTPVPQVAY